MEEKAIVLQEQRDDGCQEKGWILTNISVVLGIRSIIIKKALETVGFEMGRSHDE